MTKNVAITGAGFRTAWARVRQKQTAPCGRPTRDEHRLGQMKSLRCTRAAEESGGRRSQHAASQENAKPDFLFGRPKRERREVHGETDAKKPEPGHQ